MSSNFKGYVDFLEKYQTFSNLQGCVGLFESNRRPVIFYGLYKGLLVFHSHFFSYFAPRCFALYFKFSKSSWASSPSNISTLPSFGCDVHEQPSFSLVITCTDVSTCVAILKSLFFMSIVRFCVGISSTAPCPQKGLYCCS